ncbi:amidase [Kibdelosporangium banguiense]|uniref:Amidase n=1 Tax=Kibdelosporangium banguiense TaxID=1365924 RepID=A0ABS4T6Y7_9PSEU|nr:amidase [Kibdelosporangium banguiense]MBP2320174.1 amidase [Kibdelosporangium banguiense]
MTEFVGLQRTVELVAAGDTSSVDLVTEALDRIEKAQPSLNAFRRLRREAALEEAARADERLAAGERAPLLGVPLAVKDDTDIAGEPSAFGCAGDFPIKTEDAELVRRLRQAGAVIVGKTNTPEFGQWPFTEGHAFGATRNPWDVGYTPGGSSGGSAAAVAAGLIPAATGSDGLGSIRIPAAWTGLVGIKPTRGLVTGAPQPDLWNGLATHGPLARTVQDAALLLDVIAATGTRMQDSARREPGRLRIALALRVPFSLAPTKLDPEVRRGVVRLGRVLARLGHEVKLASPKYGIVGLGVFPRSLGGLREAASHVPDLRLLDKRTQLNARMGALGAPFVKLAHLHERFERRRLGRIFDTADVVLAPTTATAPTPIGHYDGLSDFATTRAMIATCPYAWPWNILGLPGINVPAGLTSSGLPIGAQIIGVENSEPTLISLAAQLQNEEHWQDRTPPSSG